MTSDVGISIEIKSKGNGAKTIKRDLDEIAKSGNKATNSTQKLEKQMGSAERATKTLTRAVAGLMAAYGAGALIRFSDNITTIETQLKNVTRNTEEYTRRFNELFRIAQSTGDSFSDLTGNFVRLNSSLPDAIKNTTDLTKITELLSRGFAASGANAQTAGAVMTQLTQGLAGNFANAAQEINSLIEGTPLLAKIIAEQLGGKAATDLKRFAEEGRLTTETLIAALLAAEDAIKASEIPPTIGRSIQRIRNEYVRLGSESGALESASVSLTRALKVVADNLEIIIKLMAVTGAAAITGMIKNLGLLTGATLSLSGAMATLRAVTATTLSLLGGIPGIIVGAGVALWAFWDDIVKFSRNFEVFGTKVNEVFAFVADSVAGTFSGVVNIVKGSIAQLEVLLFKFTDKISQTAVGRKLGISTYDLGGDALEKINLANMSIAERFNEGFTRATSNGFLTREFLSDTDVSDAKAELEKFTKGGSTISGNQGTKKLTEEQKKLAAAIKSSRTEEERLIDTINQLEGLKGVAAQEGKTAQLETAIDRAKDKLQEFYLEVEKDGAAYKAFEAFAEQIDDGFREAFRTSFTESDGGFDKLLEGWKNTFKTFLADLAYQATLRPIMVSLVGAVGGIAGVSSAAQASVLGSGDGIGSLLSGGSGFGLGDIGSLLSNGFSGLTAGLNAPIFSAGSTIGGAINSIGSSLGLTNANFVGPMLPGASSLASAFTPMAGIAGFGGNFLANSLFGSDRGIGASIGGIAGGIGGTAIGASLGTILGMAGGPVGALIGAFAGNALGGLFGGKSVPSNAADIQIRNTNGSFNVGRTSSDEASAERLKQINDAGSSVVEQLNALVSGIGGTLVSAPNFRIGATRREPGIAVISGMRGSGQSGEFVFNSFQKAVDFALTNVLGRAEISGLSEGFQKFFKETFEKGGSFQARATEILEAKQIFDLIEGFEKVAEASNPLKDALDDLDKQFADLKDKATNLGLPVDKLTESYEAQRKAFITGALQPLQDFLDAQSLSQTSSLSAVERLSLSRSAFDENLSAIQGGDLSGLGSITAQASQLLGFGREVFASGEGFNALESFVRQSITGIGEQLGGEGALENNIAREITLSNAQQTSIMQQMLVELEELRKENKELRKSMERVGNSLNA